MISTGIQWVTGTGYTWEVSLTNQSSLGVLVRVQDVAALLDRVSKYVSGNLEACKARWADADSSKCVEWLNYKCGTTHTACVTCVTAWCCLTSQQRQDL